MSRLTTVQELKKFSSAEKKRLNKYKFHLAVCGGTGCQANNCSLVLDAVRAEIDKRGLQEKVSLSVTGCHGFCEQGPLMIVDPLGILYCKIKPERVVDIFDKTILKRVVLEDLCYSEPGSKKKILKDVQVPFYKFQTREVLDMNKKISSSSITEYMAEGGYQALAKAVSKLKSKDIIAEVKKSGLRGRGGAGFPAGVKWEQAASVENTPRFVICNADEGDPGAYMDRSVLEGNPHRVIEGMIIGAYAVGASSGVIYVRKEYPLAVINTSIALEKAKEYGMLGENILGSGFSFNIRIVRGGGAFVCGESSALMQSIRGKVGEPRAKDVHAVERGLDDQPTVLNNVETWANIPLIIQKGSVWFNKKGTASSKGTKIFALTGMINNTGLVEVAMGTPLKKIIYDIGGGAPEGRRIKAVQTGGPSGGCLPPEKFDLPVDFEALTDAGSMVGSGGLIVMDESNCMVDVAKYFLDFLLGESCGKCSTCRIGLSRMLEIVNDISEGKGTEEQLVLLEDIAETVAVASLCGLGKTAANPVLSTLRYFRKEYEAHIHDGHCPAGVCKPLISYSINTDLCANCGLCLKECSQNAITGSKTEGYKINLELCSKCGICRDVCRFNAIVVS